MNYISGIRGFNFSKKNQLNFSICNFRCWRKFTKNFMSLAHFWQRHSVLRWAQKIHSTSTTTPSSTAAASCSWASKWCVVTLRTFLACTQNSRRPLNVGSLILLIRSCKFHWRLSQVKFTTYGFKNPEIFSSSIKSETKVLFLPQSEKCNESYVELLSKIHR